MSDRLIGLLGDAEKWAHHFRSNLHSYENRTAITEHIEKLKVAASALKQSKMDLATGSKGEDSDRVRKEHERESERENDSLIHALHDVSKELIRTTGELRSLQLVLSKSDLGKTEKIEMKLSELTGTVNEVKTNALKVLAEIRARVDVADARIATLETQLADADVPEAAATALADLKAVVTQMDDIVPDSTELPTVPPVVIPPTPA